MSHRDPDREAAFLADAARGHEPFVRQATARLTAGQETYGDSWAWIGLRRHVTELLEEAADLGAWAALAAQALDHEANLSVADRDRISGVLAAAAQHGARAHALLSTVTATLGGEVRSCP